MYLPINHECTAMISLPIQWAIHALHTNQYLMKIVSVFAHQLSLCICFAAFLCTLYPVMLHPTHVSSFIDPKRLVILFLGDNYVGVTLACLSFFITVMLIYGALMVRIISTLSSFVQGAFHFLSKHQKYFKEQKVFQWFSRDFRWNSINFRKSVW